MVPYDNRPDQELKHARIAMIAITGFWFQLMITGEVYPIL